MTWRIGRKLGRTIYLQIGAEPSERDTFLGIMETQELAEMVVDAHNTRVEFVDIDPDHYRIPEEERGAFGWSGD